MLTTAALDAGFPLRDVQEAASHADPPEDCDGRLGCQADRQFRRGGVGYGMKAHSPLQSVRSPRPIAPKNDPLSRRECR